MLQSKEIIAEGSCTEDRREAPDEVHQCGLNLKTYTKVQTFGHYLGGSTRTHCPLLRAQRSKMNFLGFWVVSSLTPK
mgnify:CR=1 FL=1